MTIKLSFVDSMEVTNRFSLEQQFQWVASKRSCPKAVFNLLTNILKFNQ